MNAFRLLLAAALLPLACLSPAGLSPAGLSPAGQSIVGGQSIVRGEGPSAAAGPSPTAGPVVVAGLVTGPGVTAGPSPGVVPDRNTAPEMAPEAATAGTWLWPLPPPHPVLRGFQAPATLYAPGHRGLDLAAEPGREVVAPADGVVSYAGVVVDRPVLTIEHADGLVSTLEPVSAGVAVGDRVTAGQPVGQVADGGHCAGRCLHLGARLNGGYVSPLLYLVGVPRAVLLPALLLRGR